MLHLHGIPLRFDALARVSIIRVNAFCADARSIQKQWQSIIPDKQVYLAMNGVDQNIYHPGAGKRDIDILFVGRFIETKGLSYLIHSLRRSQKVVFVGKGPLSLEIQRISKKVGVNIYFPGFVSHTKLIQYYQRAKIFVSPSIGKEGVLTTMLEAASSGCAIVSTRVSGIVDFAKHRSNSLLISAGDSRGLRRALDILLKNPSMTQRIGAQARRDIERGWTWDERICQLEEIYMRITDTK